ncbi:MAG: CPBP family intramembrane metalloprotease [Clostridiales bacterium]|nr:CPBP family intramembrane metalloprotease [Clostridiales bacterium]
MSYRSRIAFRFFLCPFICIIVYFVIMFFSMQVAALLEGEKYLDHEGLIYLIEGVFGVAVCILWCLIKKKYELGTPTISSGKAIDWIYAVVSAFSMMGVAVLYFYLVKNLHISAIQKSLEDYDEMMDMTSISQADLYMNVIGTCIFVPILEEMLFRGFLMQGMLELKKPLLAIFASALVFGGMHGQPIQIGYAFLAGLMLGSLYYLTRNLFMTILAHMIFNLMGSGIYMLWSIPEAAENVLTGTELAAIVAFAVITVYMALKRKERFSKVEEETGDINTMLPERHT